MKACNLLASVSFFFMLGSNILSGDYKEIDLSNHKQNNALENPFFPLNRSTIPVRTDQERFLFEEQQTSPSSSQEPSLTADKDSDQSNLKHRMVLEPIYQTKYFPQVQVIAPVVKLNFKEGDSFKKGDQILLLDPDKFRAFYEKTQSALEKSREEYISKERLFKDGNASFFDLAEAKSNLATSEAEVVFARKNLEAIEIIAPYDGKVSSLSIELFELPLENKEMLEIINDKVLNAKFLLPSNMFKKVKVGDVVEIHIEETDETIKTHISRVAAVIEPTSSTFKVEAGVQNFEGKWVAGMRGYAVLK